ncbi:MAG: hypothetical protein GY854_14110 [Deltaproteobacteria bacterium]|nr:hypothetical protein [Deltaproteobacteria bacterium]
MKRISLLAISLFLVWCLAGCGGSQTQEVRWIKGSMPASGNFDGVYQSDFGRLELTANGATVVGLYESDQHYGRVEGKIEGNLLLFNWTQWNEEMRGKVRKTSGEGVFQYVIEEVPIGNKTKEYHRLEGWWGYDDGDLTNRWNGPKLSSRAKKRLKPHEESASSGGDDGYNTSVGFDDSQEEPSGGGSHEEEEEEEDEGGGLDDVF